MQPIIQYAIMIVLAVLSFAVALFGFSQIIGSIQHAHTRSRGATAFTTILWVIILAAYGFLVVKCYGAHRVASYIAAGIGFLFSLRHQEHDAPIGTAPTQEVPSSITTKEEELAMVDHNLRSLHRTYHQAVEDLGDYTVERVMEEYHADLIDKETADTMINDIECLQQVIAGTPSMIESAMRWRSEITEEIESLQNTSSNSH